MGIGQTVPMLAAHAGHWAVGILYAVPVFAVLIAIGISIARERRRGEGGEPAETAVATPENGAAGPDEPAL